MVPGLLVITNGNFADSLIIQDNLNPQSKTAIEAREEEKILRHRVGVVCQTLDLRPFCMKFCGCCKLKDYNAST